MAKHESGINMIPRLIAINKNLVSEIGIKATYLLAILHEESFVQKTDWFPMTIAELEEESTLTRYEQDVEISVLEKYGLIEKKVNGLPPKRYFKISRFII